MDDESRQRGIDKIKDCVTWVIEQSLQNITPPCPTREKWTWERLFTLGSPKERKKSTLTHPNPTYKFNNNHKNENNEYENNENVGKQVIDSPVDCCRIKMQDPCAACCCESEARSAPSTCPDGLRTQRRRPTCGCNTQYIKQAEACCEACKINIQSS